jgi:hypothetical protein
VQIRKVSLGKRYVSLQDVDAAWADEQARAIDEAKGKPKRKASG